MLAVFQTANIQAQTSNISKIGLTQVSIPDSTAAAFLAWPSTIAKNPQLELLPYEIIQAWGNQYFGVDPLECPDCGKVSPAPVHRQPSLNPDP